MAILLAAFYFLPATSPGTGTPATPALPKAALDILADSPGSMHVDELVKSAEADVPVRPEDAKAVCALLWQKYRGEQMRDPVRIEENKACQLHFGSVMRYSCRKAGEKPTSGYPLYIALHGGGSCPAEANDDAWQSMTTFYLGSVKQGLYVAPRGVADAWNLHSLPDSFPLYDRLIENMILFEDADPNRVYILGYSAGGDGVYQVAPRMADRLAAANMSAGHPNGVGAVNLFNLPFLVQMGEKDTAYDRHLSAPRFAMALDALQKEYGGGYIHDCFLHLDKGHGIMEHNPNDLPQVVIANLSAWLQNGDRSTKTVDANAISWVRQHVRNPWPTRVIWDLRTRADRSGVRSTGERLWATPVRGQLFYWLDISGSAKGQSEVDLIDVHMDKAANAIVIEKTTDWLRLLLNGSMLDLSKPVTVKIAGKVFTVTVHPNLRTMARTLVDRGDPNYCFEAEITVEKNGDTWRVSGS